MVRAKRELQQARDALAAEQQRREQYKGTGKGKGCGVPAGGGESEGLSAENAVRARSPAMRLRPSSRMPMLKARWRQSAQKTPETSSRGSGLCLHAANCTMVCSSAYRCVRRAGASQCEVMGFAETHLPLPRVARRRLGSKGWHTYWPSAQPSGKGGAQGGTAILVAEQLECHSLACWLGIEEGDAVLAAHGWCVVVIAL